MKIKKTNRPKHRSSFVLIAAIAMVAASFPAQAWRAAGGGGRGVAVGPRGGAAAWNHGAGVARGPHGGTAAWNNRGYHGGGVYRPPARVYGGGGYYGGYSGGQVAGAAVAGMAVGAVVGAAAASNSAPPPQSTTVIVHEQAHDYSSQLPIGTRMTVLPGNCGNATLHGVEYYVCGPNWFKPYFGNSSVYYQVVQAP